MEKAEGAFRTIGEMARELNVKPHVLRYWEEQFPMLKPLKRAGGRRLYRGEDIALLHRIRSLLEVEGYTIRGARQLLSGKTKAAPAATPAKAAQAPQQSLFDVPAEGGAELIAALRTIRARLAAALAGA